MVNYRVVITARNCVSFVGECFESLLSQEGNNWSAIAFDDASDDGTAEAMDAEAEPALIGGEGA